MGEIGRWLVQLLGPELGAFVEVTLGILIIYALVRIIVWLVDVM